MGSGGEHVRETATGSINNGWGCVVYCTFPQSVTWTKTSEGSQSEGASSNNSKADQAIERIKQWLEYGLRLEEKSPLSEQLEQSVQWTIYYVPGANIGTVRSSFKAYLKAENVFDEEGWRVKRTQRMCLMLDEDMADAILATPPVPSVEDWEADIPTDIFVEVVDPAFEGEPKALSQAGRGPPPPYPAAGVTWYVGSIKCIPESLWLLYRTAAYNEWDYEYAADMSLGKDLWTQ